jgi:hypothetical protein
LQKLRLFPSTFKSIRRHLLSWILGKEAVYIRGFGRWKIPFFFKLKKKSTFRKIQNVIRRMIFIVRAMVTLPCRTSDYLFVTVSCLVWSSGWNYSKVF